MRTQISRVLGTSGYRYMRVQPEDAGLFYKFCQGTYRVVLAVDDQSGLDLTVPKLQTMIQSVNALFYNPTGRVPDHDPAQPVYHVEVMTLLFGYQPDHMHVLCANVDNVWAFDSSSGHLIVYENQPGDFDGLREKIEQISTEPERPVSAGAHKAPAAGNPVQRYQKWAVTAGILICNILVFLVLELMGSTEDPAFMLAHGADYPVHVIEMGEYWRLFTSMFLHFGLMHLMNNMIMLACAGARLEEALGHGKYAALYLLSGLGGSALSILEMLRTGDYAVSAGASGAIFGVIGALLWVVIRNKGHYETLTTRGLLFMIALCLYYGVSVAGVDNWAHVGGLVSGFLLSVIFYRRKRQKH